KFLLLFFHAFFFTVRIQTQNRKIVMLPKLRLAPNTPQTTQGKTNAPLLTQNCDASAAHAEIDAEHPADNSRKAECPTFDA
ncbi:hypothetical protein BX666DRAFT_1906458, partial [Dichotomocladium elegans]